MNFLSVTLAGLLTLLTLTFAVLLVSAIIFNVNAGRKYRKSLAAKVDQLRLSKMLTALGIDVTAYLHSESMVDIHRHMSRCSACENTAICDDNLASGEIDSADIGFCNNEQSLQEMVRKSAQTT